MKKFLALMMIFVFVLASAACTNNSSHDNPPQTVSNNSKAEEKTTIAQPKLSAEFVETALQYIDEYPAESEELLDLSAKLIQQAGNFRDELFYYLNETYLKSYEQFIGSNYDKIETVCVWVHNYDHGEKTGCVSFNGQNAVYNYNHDPLLLSASLLSTTYPDNVTLAKALVSAYVLLNMDENDVYCCIKKSSEGEYYYDFTFQNEDFANTSRKILKGLCEE